MATYIFLIDWTEHGLKHVKDSPKRLDAAKKMLTDVGGKFIGFYMTMGKHDMMLIADMPDDATVAKMALGLGMQGNVRTHTLKAFSEAEYKTIVDAVG